MPDLNPGHLSTCCIAIWTASRDSELALDFVAVNYYDGQGFMVKKDLGVSSAKELDGATVCIQTGTTTELNLADFFKQNNITYPKRDVSNSTNINRTNDSKRFIPIFSFQKIK